MASPFQAEAQVRDDSTTWDDSEEDGATADRRSTWCSSCRWVGVEAQAVALPTLGEVMMGVVDDVAGADGTGEALNPLAISHTPMNTSHRPPGMAWIESRLNPSTSSTDPNRIVAYPTKPHTATSLGTNCAL